jgi:hypothetical protein
MGTTLGFAAALGAGCPVFEVLPGVIGKTIGRAGVAAGAGASSVPCAAAAAMPPIANARQVCRAIARNSFVNALDP